MEGEGAGDYAQGAPNEGQLVEGSLGHPPASASSSPFVESHEGEAGETHRGEPAEEQVPDSSQLRLLP